MTPTPDQLAAASSRVVLLTLFWGGQVARYARYENPIVANGNTFAPLPDLESASLRRTGGSEPESLNLTTHTLLPPFSTITSQPEHAPVEVVVGITDPNDPTSSYREIFMGFYAKAMPDQDREGIYVFTFGGIKSKMDRRIGVIADEYCQATLGDKRCKVDFSAFELSGELTDIGTDGVPNKITVALGAGVDLRSGRWRTGAIVRNGLALTIRTAEEGNKFTLDVPPPGEWLNQTVEVKPGCDGLLKTCKTIWQNESEFSGYGLDMVAADSLTEIGRGNVVAPGSQQFALSG